MVRAIADDAPIVVMATTIDATSRFFKVPPDLDRVGLQCGLPGPLTHKVFGMRTGQRAGLWRSLPAHARRQLRQNPCILSPPPLRTETMTTPPPA
jgi:hypothetical protein